MNSLLTALVLWMLTVITGVLIINFGWYAILLAWATLTFPVWIIGYRMGKKDAYAEDSQ